MKYRISLYGKGNELTIGTINKETWDYIQENFGGDEYSYQEALDNGDVPEEHMLASDSCSMYECDDQWHDSGCWTDCFRIEVEKIEDSNMAEENVFTCTDGDVKENGIEMETDDYAIDGAVPYLCLWSSVAKGLYLTGDFESAGEFDPKKLKIKCKRVSFNNDEHDSIVSGFEYDGEDIECDFDSAEGKGDTLRFIEVEQRVKEEE